MIRDTSIQRVAILCLMALAMAPTVLAGGVRPNSRKQKEDISESYIAASPSSFKVNIELYYMPQCPGCRQLISTSISEAFQTPGFADMANVEFKPWGRKHQEIGVGRIFDNVLESCALQKIGNHHQDTQFMYIECIDRAGNIGSNPSAVDRSCAKVVGLDDSQIEEIEECALSKEGHALADKYLREADAMEMIYAPWIVVNGYHSKEQEDKIWHSLFYYVCEIYKGPYRSSGCPQTGDSIEEQL